MWKWTYGTIFGPVKDVSSALACQLLYRKKPTLPDRPRKESASREHFGNEAPSMLQMLSAECLRYRSFVQIVPDYVSTAYLCAQQGITVTGSELI